MKDAIFVLVSILYHLFGWQLKNSPFQPQPTSRIKHYHLELKILHLPQ